MSLIKRIGLFIHTKNIATIGIRDEQSIYRTTRVQRENDSVPLTSIFKRLCEGVCKHPATTSIGSIDEQIYNTPKTSRNKRKGFSGNLYNFAIIMYVFS